MSVPLFGKRGVFREGQKDLKLANPSASQQVNPTAASTENFQRLGKLTKKYHAGKIPQIDWLDRLTFAEIEKINQKEKLSSNQLFLMIEFPQVRRSQLRFNKNFSSLVEFLFGRVPERDQDSKVFDLGESHLRRSDDTRMKISQTRIFFHILKRAPKYRTKFVLFKS